MSQPYEDMIELPIDWRLISGKVRAFVAKSEHDVTELIREEHGTLEFVYRSQFAKDMLQGQRVVDEQVDQYKRLKEEQQLRAAENVEGNK